VFSATAEGLRTTGTMELVGKVLNDAQLKITEIDTVLVGMGPGSYTGVRAALAFAQGWKLGTEGTILGISTNDILAHDLKMAGKTGPWRIVIDAQKKEFYSIIYTLSGVGFQVEESIRIVAGPVIEEAKARNEPMAGPESQRLTGGMDLYPTGESMIRIFDTMPQYLQTDLEPIYLRPISFVKAPKRPPLPDGLSMYSENK
jgi:tRNA threonylcarbamoyl adenosine modification protein YeaZ